MKVDILATGSRGNCIAISVDDSCILIDAGIAKTKIEKRLLEVGIRADQIKAILVTHAHGDHTKGLPLANKYKIPVYAGEEEWKSIDKVDEDLRRSFEMRKTIADVYPFVITPFPTHHDSFEPVGYSVVDVITKSKASVCLDTGHVDEEMIKTMKESNFYIIESNHDPNMVEASEYPNSIKARVLSHIGHLSNRQTAEALSELIQGKGEHIFLTHLSSNNNFPSLAEMTTVNALRKKGFKKDTDYQLEVVTD